MKKMSLEELSREIVDFLLDFDAYEFRDNYDDEDDAIYDVEHMLLNGEDYIILNYLDDILDYFDNDDDINIYNHALKIMNNVERFNA